MAGNTPTTVLKKSTSSLSSRRTSSIEPPASSSSSRLETVARRQPTHAGALHAGSRELHIEAQLIGTVLLRRRLVLDHDGMAVLNDDQVDEPGELFFENFAGVGVVQDDGESVFNPGRSFFAVWCAAKARHEMRKPKASAVGTTSGSAPRTHRSSYCLGHRSRVLICETLMWSASSMVHAGRHRAAQALPPSPRRRTVLRCCRSCRGTPRAWFRLHRAPIGPQRLKSSWRDRMRASTEPFPTGTSRA